MGLYIACQETLAFWKKKTLLGKHLNLATYQKCDEFHDSTITLKCKIIEVTLCLNVLKYLPKKKVSTWTWTFHAWVSQNDPMKKKPIPRVLNNFEMERDLELLKSQKTLAHRHFMVQLDYIPSIELHIQGWGRRGETQYLCIEDTNLIHIQDWIPLFVFLTPNHWKSFSFESSSQLASSIEFGINRLQEVGYGESPQSS